MKSYWRNMTNSTPKINLSKTSRLSAKFSKLDEEVLAVEKRIVNGVQTLAREIARRNLQLEQMVDECNELRAARVTAKARCRELVCTQEQLDATNVQGTAEAPADQ